MNAADHLHVYARLVSAWRSQWWSAERIRAHQERALLRIMRHAAEHVPYYRRLGIDPRSISSSADLTRFPLLTKRDVQGAADSLLAEGSERPACSPHAHRAARAEPTTTYFDRPAWLLGKYVLKMRRVAATSGIAPGRRVLVVSEQPPDALRAAAQAAPSGLGVFFQQRLVSIHDPIDEHLEVLCRVRPHIVYAFPSYLLDLISAAERKRSNCRA